MDVSVSEVLRLGLMALVIPPFLFLNRSVRYAPGCRQLLAAACVIAVSYVLTVLEGLVLGEVLDMLHHVCYGAAGALTLWGGIAMLRAERSEGVAR